MGTISARKLRDQIDLIYLQYAVHILAVCQAVDLIGASEFGEFTQRVYAEVRAVSAPLVDDRRLDADAEKVARWLEATEIFE